MLYFFKLQGLFEVTKKEKVVGIEIHTKQNHEDGYYPLGVSTVAHETVVFNTKTTGSRCGKTGSNGIEPVNSTTEKEDDFQYGKTKIDNVQNSGRIMYLWNQLPYGRSRTLCTHEVHVGTATHWDDCKQKDKNAHSTNPVRKASPEEHTVGQTFNI